ncbi:MAG: NUDIX hydrolase [bacterium]|nr:NUDIX hydrolase [bacterium]
MITTPIIHAARKLRQFPWLMNAARDVWRITRPRYSAGSVGVIFNDTGAVLVVEHVFHAHCPWGLPGGYLDLREDPAVAVARELREELELDVTVGPVLAVERNYGAHLDFAYLCRAKNTIGRLSPELISYRWAHPAELPELIPFHRRAIAAAQQQLNEKQVWTI